MSVKYSSITKKIWMSLMGLFLMVFLVVHLSINLLLLVDPTRELFNTAAHFMGTNPFIQTFQWVLFLGFTIHIILGFVLQIQNWIARPKGYKVKATSEDSFFSKYMIHTGVIILIFLGIHFVNFFFRVKIFHTVPDFILNGVNTGMEDMGIVVVELFQNPSYVIGYVIALIILGFHLDHGFQSAWQSIGVNNSKYTPFLKGFGHLYAIFIPLGFIAIPVVIYLTT
ncbi:MAG: succinate dehydrogenase cytochrome b subunit [Bacteroidales bacterium]|nr:succinate dehydrogenase cytochrome b subunit [Bacteroidales bacterium]MDG2080945.1 succinate dehydrogenase cytochrome b subunit [Bacteroidales bacterium]